MYTYTSPWVCVLTFLLLGPAFARVCECHSVPATRQKPYRATVDLTDCEARAFVEMQHQRRRDVNVGQRYCAGQRLVACNLL